MSTKHFVFAAKGGGTHSQAKWKRPPRLHPINATLAFLALGWSLRHWLFSPSGGVRGKFAKAFLYYTYFLLGEQLPTPIGITVEVFVEEMICSLGFRPIVRFQ